MGKTFLLVGYLSRNRKIGIIAGSVLDELIIVYSESKWYL